MKVIIYTNSENELCIVRPVEQFSEIVTIDDIAHASVPAGIPFKIIDDSNLPTDRAFRNAWEVDTTTNPDGVAVEDGVVITTVDGFQLVKGMGFVEL